MAAPISLAAAKRRRRQTANNDDAPPPPDDEGMDERACPITALGHIDGKFHFLNIEGERRALTARQLGSRPEITALFLGNMEWLTHNPRFASHDDEGKKNGWKINKATEYLMDACRRQGIYGDHIIIRRPGVWPGENGIPVAHCGNALFIQGEKLAPGLKIAGQIFASAPRAPYPASVAAPASVARNFQASIGDLWNFSHQQAAPIIALGLVGQSYLAACLTWRANGFIIGGSNAGKSSLLELLRAMTPLCHYTNDTSKAGIEGAVSGRALPTYVDEAAERSDGNGGVNLLDVVLSASSGSGTKGHRGTADGGMRTIEMVGSVIMAAINPPPMQPQHRSRFSLIELLSPAPGVDHRTEMQALTAEACLAGPALFARALASYARYRQSLTIFRAALRDGGCVAREMDHLGAILSGWWIMVEDGIPSPAAAAGTVAAIEPFIRGGEEMMREGGPSQVLNLLLSKVVSLDRSTDQETIAKLIEHALRSDSDTGALREQAVKVLERWGIRVIRAGDEYNQKNQRIPRAGAGNGIWIDQRASLLRGIFKDTPFDGDKWIFEIFREPVNATRARMNVKVGALASSKAIWISYDHIMRFDDTG